MQLEGQLQKAKERWRILTPKVFEIDAEPVLDLQPIYPERGTIGRSTVEKALHAAQPWIDLLQEPLPTAWRKELGLPSLARAIRQLHRPQDLASAEQGRRRLAFGEVLRLEQMHRAQRQRRPRKPIAQSAHLWQRIYQRLPFDLNEDQERVLAEMRADLNSGRRMQRLLHGEVGSGKTAVAFALALAVAGEGGQVAFLAPTEILARQHLATFRRWLAGSRIRIGTFLGDDRPAQRREACRRLAADQIDLAIGTHALFSPGVEFADLQLVILDEQHRFGVRQKNRLLAKGEEPHVLTMTATPIPRTLAWARYGTLDPSVLRQRAGDGGDIRTQVLAQSSLIESARALRPALEAGEQAFVVVPHIDGEDGLQRWHAELMAGPWRGLTASVVHGRLEGAAIEAAVDAFRERRTALLFGTTVVEVGLDVPRIAHMFVLHAERLGLASLHQLRGRLARTAPGLVGHCRLFCAQEGAMERLQGLEQATDGFTVADLDLAQRGPGALLGTAQAGQGGFQAFDPGRDADLVAFARRLELQEAILEAE